MSNTEFKEITAQEWPVHDSPEPDPPIHLEHQLSLGSAAQDQPIPDQLNLKGLSADHEYTWDLKDGRANQQTPMNNILIH